MRCESIKNSISDFIISFKKHDLWFFLGCNDIKQKYRRSKLGKSWLIVSTAIFMGMISIVWSTLFKQNLHEYLPYFSISWILWIYISTVLSESTTGFTQYEYIIKQIKLPFPIYILRLITRNIIVFLYNFILIFIIILFVGKGWSFTSLLAIIGFTFLTISLFSLSMIIAIITTKHRDFQMIVQSVLPVIFYVSPIMWQSKLIIGKHQWLIDYNPLVPFFDLIRKPIFGIVPDFYTYEKVIFFTILIFFISLIMYRKSKFKIAYWL